MTLTLNVIAAVLTLLVVTIGFTTGYEVEAAELEAFFGADVVVGLQTLLDLPQWVLATVACALVIFGHMTMYFADRARHMLRMPILWAASPFLLFLIARAAGVLFSPNATNHFDGWVDLMMAGVGAAILTITQAIRFHRAREIDLVDKGGVETSGFVTKRLTYYSSDEPKTRVRVEFTDKVGTARSARGRLDGHLELGAKVRVYYVPNDPKVNPVIERLGAQLDELPHMR